MRVINISRNEDIKTLLFADDLVIVTDSEDALRISIHALETVTSKYGLNISTSNMKKTAF